MRWKAAILTASDRGVQREKEDASVQIIREMVEEDLSGTVVETRIVPDEMDEITAALIEMVDYYDADLILTTGGTGLGPRDVTPEATARVIERRVPGIAEDDVLPACSTRSKRCCGGAYAASADAR